MTVPRATARLQFHRTFTFAHATTLIPYFAALGISHLYASPILTARAGSMHGYDVVDPTRVSAELGGEDALRALVAELRHHGMGLIVDIVPNHMAVSGANAWWMDVLARGPHSRYAKYFDIDWTPRCTHLRGKVLLPILGRPYGEALAAGEITLQRSGASSAQIRYFDHVLPLNAEAVAMLAAASSEAFVSGSSEGRARLHGLLERQYYRLAWWRCANDEINWRRFFDINDLAALRVEDTEVFEAVHATPFRLYQEGFIDGFRVDHIDGLAQPESYCQNLRERLRALAGERPRGSPGGPAYLIVEKILAGDEDLPKSWGVDGTTGYDFMDEISSLQHDPAGEQPLCALWQQVSGRSGHFADEEELARREILQRSFAAQLEATAQAFENILQDDLATRDISRAALRRGLTEILVHFPTYRIYARVGQASPADGRFLKRAVAGAMRTCLPGDRQLVAKLGEWLGGVAIRDGIASLQDIALARFQQLSAPLCAKAVEDTAFYRYGRLLSRNDVGFDAACFANTPTEFHRRMERRVTDFPHALLATATHDHKRGEDVRARLAVISELAGLWAKAVTRWLDESARCCIRAGDVTMPSTADRALLFQMIVGAWPIGLSTADRAGMAAYAERLIAWQQKALREAKLASDWSAPNEAYERAAAYFVDALFASSDPLGDIVAFARRITRPGVANSLAQTLAKLTAPGVPDLYQGAEYWDLSLVDPDNRAPVDFATRRGSLDDASPATLIADWVDGRVKQAMIARVLGARRSMPALFASGHYIPLDVVGPLSTHVVAFARALGKRTIVTVFCRLTARLFDDEDKMVIPPTRWHGTRIVFPTDLHDNFTSVFGDTPPLAIDGDLPLDIILQRLPVAFLTNRSE